MHAFTRYSGFKGRHLPLAPFTKMSRFFATGDTDTESSSESSDEEPRLVGGARGTTGAAIGAKYAREGTHVVGQGALNRSMYHYRICLHDSSQDLLCCMYA